MNPLIIAIAAGLGLIFGLLGGVVMALPKVQIPHKKKEVIADLSDPVAPKTMDDFTQVAKELDAWRKELTDKRNQAIQYDAELLRREELLKAEKEALMRERQRLMDLQKDIDTSLIKIKSAEEPKLQQLADLYSTMKAEDAVNLLKQSSTDDATKIFTHLSPKIQAKYISVWLNTATSDDEKKSLLTILDGMKRVVPDDGSSASSGTDNSANPGAAN